MPIPVIQYTDPRLSQPLRPSPWLTGIQAGMGLAGQMEQLIQNARMAPLKKALVTAQTQKLQADIPLTEAQAAKTQQEAKFAPLSVALKAQQQKQSASRFGAAYQLARMVQSMPQAQRSAWIAAHPQEWEGMQQSLVSQALGGGEAPGQDLIDALMKKTFPDIYSEMPEKTVGQVTQPSQNVPATLTPSAAIGKSAQPTLAPSGETAQAPATLTPSPYAMTTSPQASLEDSYKLGANKLMVNTQMNKRAENAVQLDKWMYGNREEYKNRINNVLEYAGAAGKSKRFFQEWANKNPDKLSDYDWFDKTFTTTLSNSIKLMEGLGATDQQRQELQALVGQIDDVKSNPVRAKKALNKFFSTMQQVSSSVIDAAEPIHKGVYGRMYGLKPFEGEYLSEDRAEPVTKTAENDPLGIR